MDQKHLGAWGENVAITWLQEQGYEVFHNVSPHGPLDIVIFNTKTEEFTGIDVKTTPTLDKNTPPGAHPSFVRILYVHPGTSKCWWPEPRPDDELLAQRAAQRKSKNEAQARFRAKNRMELLVKRAEARDATKAKKMRLEGERLKLKMELAAAEQPIKQRRYSADGRRLSPTGVPLPDWMTTEYWAKTNKT